MNWPLVWGISAITCIALTIMLGLGFAAAVSVSCRHAGWEYGGWETCTRTYPGGAGQTITESVPWPLGTPALQSGQAPRVRIP